MKRIAFFLVAIVLISCEYDQVEKLSFGDGVYEGQFFRGSPLSLPVPVKVKIEIDNNAFSGSADGRLPVICKGTFALGDGTITFSNRCFFTADFDWTYILDGEYNISLQEDQVTLTKSYDGGVTDVYQLKKSVDSR